MTRADRLADRVDEVCRTATGAIGVEQAVATAVREAVPFDRWCVLTVDPAVALPTGGYHDEGVPPELVPRLSEIEARGEDVLALADMARTGQRAGTLAAATGGELERSPRYRDVFAPAGVQHELRVLFTSGEGVWGALVMMRDAGRSDFSRDETELVRRTTANVAAAVRREMLLAEIEHEDGAERGPGLLLLGPDLTPTTTSDAARHWLGEIEDGVDAARELPLSVVTLAGRARIDDRPVRARLRTRRGRWVTLHAERHGDTLSVIIEPSRPSELAGLIADAYGLTAREREVVRLLALGHSRAEIARSLVISPHTVDDHVKRAYAKTGVASRAELAARIFFDHNLPRMLADVPVGGTGWFLR